MSLPEGFTPVKKPGFFMFENGNTLRGILQERKLGGKDDNGKDRYQYLVKLTQSCKIVRGGNEETGEVGDEVLIDEKGAYAETFKKAIGTGQLIEAIVSVGSKTKMKTGKFKGKDAWDIESGTRVVRRSDVPF